MLAPVQRARPPAELDNRPQGRDDVTVSVERVLSPQILLSDIHAIIGAGLRGTPLRAGESYDPMEPGLERGEPEASAAEGVRVRVRTGGRRLARLTFDRSTPRGAEFSILATPGRTLYRPSMGGARPRAAPAKAGTATYGLDGFVEEYRIEVRREREAAGVAGPIRVHDALEIRRLR